MSEFTSGDMDTWDTRTSDGRSGYYYLATPYRSYITFRSSHLPPLEEAYLAARTQAAIMAAAGIAVYSPIVHSHPVAETGRLLATMHDFWLDLDRPLLVNSIGLIVCQLPGWEHSEGIKDELKMAEEAGLPVIYMTPGVVPDGLRRATQCEAVRA